MDSSVLDDDMFKTKSSPSTSGMQRRGLVGPVLDVAAFIPLVLIAMALFGNTLSFFIFRFDSEMKKMSSLMYLSFVAIFDTFALFEWNLNHFLYVKYKFRIEDLNLAACISTTYVQFVSLQASAMLLSMTTIDRYFTIIATPSTSAWLLRLFGTARSAFYWSISISLVALLTNSHLIFVPFLSSTPTIQNISSHNSNSTNTTEFICHEYQKLATTVPMWLKVNFYIYGLVPFAIMSTFNGLTIWKTIHLRRHCLINTNNNNNNNNNDNNSTANNNNNNNNSKMIMTTANLLDIRLNRKRQRLTVSLIVITFAFLVLTVPANFAFSYFTEELFDKSSLFKLLVCILLDNLFFLNNASLFFFSYLSYHKFRQAVKYVFACKLDILLNRYTTSSNFAAGATNSVLNASLIKSNSFSYTVRNSVSLYKSTASKRYSSVSMNNYRFISNNHNNHNNHNSKASSSAPPLRPSI